MHVTSLGQRFDRCPKAWLQEQGESLEYIADWRWAQRGHLPHEGGQLDQDPQTMQAIDIIDSEAATVAEILRKQGG